MRLKVELSQIVRKKLKKLRKDLTDRFGQEVSKKSVKKITDAARSLGDFPTKGVSVTAIYDLECDYRCLYVRNNYLFYRVENYS